MKLFKKLAAAGAALMMAVTGMVMTASAYSDTLNIHYVSTGSVSNKTYDYRNRYPNKFEQTINMTACQLASTLTKVRIINTLAGVDALSQGGYSNTIYLSPASMGHVTTISIEFVNLGSGYYSSSVDFTG